MAEIEKFNPADYKVARYGDAPPRAQRQLTPELDKAAAAMGPWQTFARSAANTAMFGGGERVASWLKGKSVEDEREISARAREANPKSAIAGDVTGSVLQAIPMTAGLAAAAPVALGANTLRAGLLREGLGGLLSSAGSETVKSAEGRGDFDVGNVIGGGVTGAVGGGLGSQLPALAGHARTLVSKTADKPLAETEKAAMRSAGSLSEGRGFTGGAGLDMAQLARLSENPGLAQMASKMERIKDRAGPSFPVAQENAIRRAGLDRDIARAAERGTVRPDRPRGLLDIDRAITNAPKAPSMVPDSIPVGVGIPFLRRSHAIGAEIPVPKPILGRNVRAAEMLKDPSFAEIIGKLTEAQAVSGAVGRGTFDEARKRLQR
jgi:hypothetical protein